MVMVNVVLPRVRSRRQSADLAGPLAQLGCDFAEDT